MCGQGGERMMCGGHEGEEKKKRGEGEERRKWGREYM